MMMKALLVISDKGLKAKAFGDPAVHGPAKRQHLTRRWLDGGNTGLFGIILLFSQRVVGCVGRELRR